jgi:hypothetical protein
MTTVPNSLWPERRFRGRLAFSLPMVFPDSNSINATDKKAVDGRCHRGWVSRDNLDENGGGNQSLKAAAGSEVMIALGPEVRKRFFLGAAFDCRCASISLFP